ncbi:hypothetical protein PsYK624_148630 [Phanerochaete sordida]|uniref:Uncharacterized protein n=1 Tax=Phanerochaete sordida TaxID=48140 RepID=A0A9P3GSK5_9APHY|nr:hypothetical protein PsYK624_148630 [Phanerochaete sordida]
MANVTRVDDRDARVVYTGKFREEGKPPFEFNGTTHGTQRNGSTISFSFNGTNVAWFGTFGGGNPPMGPPSVVDFVVDGDPTTASTLTAQQPLHAMYSQTFYTSPPLSTGTHNIVVTVLDAQNDALWFDYLQFTPEQDRDDQHPSRSSSTSSTPSQSIVPTSSQATLTQVPTPSISPAPSHQSLSLGIILLAAITSSATLLLLVAVFVFWRRRQSLRRRRDEYARARILARRHGPAGVHNMQELAAAAGVLEQGPGKEAEKETDTVEHGQAL